MPVKGFLSKEQQKKLQKGNRSLPPLKKKGKLNQIF